MDKPRDIQQLAFEYLETVESGGERIPSLAECKALMPIIAPTRMLVPQEVKDIQQQVSDAAVEVTKKATTFHDLPLSDKEEEWDKQATEMPFRRWASSDDSGDKEAVNWEKYSQRVFWQESPGAEGFGKYKLRFARIQNGNPLAVWRGVTAAQAVLNGGRSGVNIPEADRRGVHNHIGRYYKKAEEDQPPLKSYDQLQQEVKEADFFGRDAIGAWQGDIRIFMVCLFTGKTALSPLQRGCAFAFLRRLYEAKGWTFPELKVDDELMDVDISLWSLKNVDFHDDELRLYDNWRAKCDAESLRVNLDAATKSGREIPLDAKNAIQAAMQAAVRHVPTVLHAEPLILTDEQREGLGSLVPDILEWKKGTSLVNTKGLTFTESQKETISQWVASALDLTEEQKKSLMGLLPTSKESVDDLLEEKVGLEDDAVEEPTSSQEGSATRQSEELVDALKDKGIAPETFLKEYLEIDPDENGNYDLEAVNQRIEEALAELADLRPDLVKE